MILMSYCRQQMKKFVTIFLILVFTSSCTKGLSTGKRELFPRGSLAWYDWTPQADIIAWENAMINSVASKPLYEICSLWDEYYYDTWVSRNFRKLISQGLIKKGEDGLYCRSPSNDRVRRAEDKAEKAKREAEDAERRTRQAEDDAYYEFKKAREAEEEMLRNRGL